MKKLEALNKYFLSGSAEGEKAIRNEVFISTPAIESFYSELHNSFILLKSQKGIGKTFFIDEFCSNALSRNILTLKIKPEDFDMEKISSATSIAAKTKAAYDFLIKAISEKIGESMADEGITDIGCNNLLAAYKRSDTYQPHLAEKALKALKFIPIDSYRKIIDGISKATDEFFKANSSTKVLEKDIASYIDEHDRTFFVFIDDIDNARNLSAVTLKSKFEDCWAIISAGFDLSTKVQNAKCIISIRDDIWLTIRNLRIGTDKADKISCIVNLTCHDTDIYNILNKRISLSANIFPKNECKGLQCFFQGAEVILPGQSATHRAWNTWLCKQSRNRPRDLVQLVEMLIRKAKEQKIDIITSDIVKECLVKFGETRLENAQDEFSGICDQLKDITQRFRDTKFSYNEIINFLKKMPSSLSISINGNPLQPEKIDSAIAILSILFMANIMNARVTDDTKALGFNHITFEDKNNFITKSNIEELQNCEFEIHPVFHSLIASQKKKY